MTDTATAKRWALWVLPLVFVAILVAMRGSSLPFWQSFNLDPDYYYLLNGLRIFEGLPPTDISHPGTPVQVLIAAVIRVMYPFASSDQVVDAVLSHPEDVLMASTSVIYALVGLSLWLMGRSIFLATGGALLPALLAQGTPMLSRIIPKFGLHPKPEAFMIIAAALLIAAIMPMVRDRRPDDRSAALAGIVMALGVACKVHFAVLGVIPLLLLDRRRLLIYIGVGAVALAVFIAPAIPSWEIWVKWMGGLIMGSGAYGQGPETVIDPTRYPQAIRKIFSSKLFFTVVIVLSVIQMVAYVRMRRRGLITQDWHARLLVGLIAAQILVVLSVAKQSAAHYLIPGLMLTGPSLAALWSLSRQGIRPRIHRRTWLGIAALLAILQVPQMIRQNNELKGWTTEQMAIDLDAGFPGCAKVYFDAASAQSYAFQRGDMNAQGRYSEKLSHLFPADEYTWFTHDHTYWKHGLMQWLRPVHLQEILDRYGCAVFRGNLPNSALPQARTMIPDFTFDDRCDMGEETLLTKGVRCDGSKVVTPTSR